MRHFVGVALFALFAVGTSTAQQEGKPVLGVSCTLNKVSYTPRDSLSLTLTLENRGSSEFYVYRTLEWGWTGLRFRLTDAAGNIVPEPSHRIPLPPPPVSDKSQLVGLFPGYFFGTRIDFDLARYNLKPGTYYFQVAYQSYYHQNQGFGLPILTFADGDYLSNKVQFDVRPR
jgi:hypothetical protein